MSKCKCCGQEEIGYGTLLDKRGYCQGCSQHSINECEEQNTRLQAKLDKVVHKLSDYEKVLKLYAEPDCLYYIATRKEDFYRLAQETLKKWENK